MPIPVTTITAPTPEAAFTHGESSFHKRNCAIDNPATKAATPAHMLVSGTYVPATMRTTVMVTEYTAAASATVTYPGLTPTSRGRRTPAGAHGPHAKSAATATATAVACCHNPDSQVDTKAGPSIVTNNAAGPTARRGHRRASIASARMGSKAKAASAGMPARAHIHTLAAAPTRESHTTETHCTATLATLDFQRR